MTSDQTLLTTSEAAKKLNCSAGTIRRWIREGKITSVRHPSGRRRVPQAVVDEILGTAAAR